MKGYSTEIPDNCASARLEGVNASYKDLAQVCGNIRKKKADWALSFLEKAAEGKAAVLYRGHNKRLGHRKELGGRKGRYPKKAAQIVLKVLQSAIANGRTKGLGDEYTIIAAAANKKNIYPRIAAKGRWARSFLATSRVEIILQGSEVPKGVEVTPPKEPEKKPEPKKKKEKPEPKRVEKKEEPKKAEAKKEEKKPEAKEEEAKKEERPPPKLLKREGREHHQHKHDMEKSHEQEKLRKEKPHQHGEDSKR